MLKPSAAPSVSFLDRLDAFLAGGNWMIAIGALVGIAAHLALLFVDSGTAAGRTAGVVPLLIVLVGGGAPLVLMLLANVCRGQFGADLLAGISIVSSVILGEYLAGALVVLMLSGGETLEAYAVRSASAVLNALARRMPSIAHKRSGDQVVDVALLDVQIGDVLELFPHEACPVDGTVVEGQGVMDEAYLTGEPYLMSKTPGSQVLSGAMNGDALLRIRADRLAIDSRYAKIMEVMQAADQQRPHLRRLGDQLGAWYTPLAVGLALLAGWWADDPVRFLAVLVVATPCPLLIAIPVSIIGAISLCARRGIIVKDPAVLEQIENCRTAIFDKTGTLTYGEPAVTEVMAMADRPVNDVLSLVASLEAYSKHPLSSAIQQAARERKLPQRNVSQISERPGEGLRGLVDGQAVQVTSRHKLVSAHPELTAQLPATGGGLECVVLIEEQLAAVVRFRDEPRLDGASFVRHLSPKHQFDRVLIVSGDRESEVRYLAERVGISEVYAGQSPEQKLEIVRREVAAAPTLFMGDGINDAPALTAATVGIAFGQNSDITSEAAAAVILETSLTKVDEFLHISRRMRTIALQSAVGGMALSLIGMLVAAAGWLPPVAGAVTQEVIDVAAVLNALRVAWPPRVLTDF